MGISSKKRRSAPGTGERGQTGQSANEAAGTHTYELDVLQSLRRIIRAVELYSRRLKAEHDLTAPQLVCLLTVAEGGDTTASRLSARMHVSPSTVVGILDRLEARGLVARERDLTDRRVVQVSITSKGRRLARGAPSPLQDNLARALSQLPDKEQATIADSLRRIVDLMEARDLDASPILKTGRIDD